MVELEYNNTKNTNNGHTPSKLNCGYHFCVFFGNNNDYDSIFCSSEELAKELRNLIFIC